MRPEGIYESRADKLRSPAQPYLWRGSPSPCGAYPDSWQFLQGSLWRVGLGGDARATRTETHRLALELTRTRQGPE